MAKEEATFTEWFPSEFIIGDSTNNDGFSILLLNQPVLKQTHFVSLWNRASIRIAVDGGGNQWNDLKQSFPIISYPNIVSGDFDSLSPDILDLFRNKSEITVVETPNQNETDFTKGIRTLCDRLASIDTSEPRRKVQKIIAYCESSGRFDQIMGNIETLFHATKILPKCQLYLMGATSITWLLEPGSHKIMCKNMNVSYCSLIPIGSPSIVTTTGLYWNLSNDKLAFGHLVSTSNELAKDNVEQIVTVSTSDPILWSMEINY